MQSAEVGEWGTTSLLWDYLCLLHFQTLPVFAVGHYYQHVKNYVKNITRRTKTKSAKKSRRFKTWVGFVGQILIQLETSFIRGFRQFPVWCPLGNNSVTTEARTSHLTRHNPMSCHAMSPGWYLTLKMLVPYVNGTCICSSLCLQTDALGQQRARWWLIR